MEDDFIEPVDSFEVILTFSSLKNHAIRCRVKWCIRPVLALEYSTGQE